MNRLPPLKTREYGSSGPFVFVLHGGPGAPGYMAPVCVRLGRDFNVIEPYQRPSGQVELTVDRHVEDLSELIASYTDQKVMIVGHSWGAVLALAFAAKHPCLADRLVIIGSSTFDKDSRAVMERIRDERTVGKIAKEFEKINAVYEDPDDRLGAIGAMYQLIDSYDLARPPKKGFQCDAAANAQSWSDLMKLENEGVYPKAFSNIDSDVLMIHGDYDSHPGEMIYKSLCPFIKKLEYVELQKCGHYPWLEKNAAHQFYEIILNWLKAPH